MRLILMLLIALLATAANAWAYACCANPNTVSPLCVESYRVTEESCCAGDYNFGKIEGMPRDRQDCIANYFSKSGCSGLSGKCAIGCCLRETENICQDNAAYTGCSGKFSTAFNGLCVKNGTYAIDGCQKACCCTGREGEILLKEACMQPARFYAGISQEQECERVCAKGATAPTAPLSRTEACTELADKEECIKSSCYWCPGTGCMYDCTSCSYQYDSFPAVPDRVCDDLCQGMVCAGGQYCKAGMCFLEPGAKTRFSATTFIIIFAIILLAAALIISSKVRAQK